MLEDCASPLERQVLFKQVALFTCAMSCNVKFSFLRGPLQDRVITHDFAHTATVSDMKKYLIDEHNACDASQSLVFVWDEKSEKLNNNDQAVSSLGANVSITVSTRKREASETSQSSTPSAPQISAGDMKSYRIRVRKVDGQSVSMSGSLPSHSTLHTLADEIVKLGHASADSFSLVLPALQGRPAAVFEPKDFTAPLESCGFFSGSMSISLQRFGSVEPSSAPKRLGATPPLPHKVPAPAHWSAENKTYAVRRIAELALPQHKEHWRSKRFGDGTADEEKKICIEMFEQEEHEMKELLQNIWKGSTWPDATCKSAYAKVACQLIVEQMYIILASTASGTNGVNHKGQLLNECDREICNHAGEYLTQQHWSCCGHERHEPCLCPAIPAPPRDKKPPPQQAARDLARLILGDDSCGFPEKDNVQLRESWVMAYLSSYNMSLALCAKFMEVAKEDPSREWDSSTIAELCPDAGSFKDATVKFLLSVSVFLKSPDAPVEITREGLEEALSGELGGMREALKQALSQHLGGSADKKPKSKYQFK